MSRSHNNRTLANELVSSTLDIYNSTLHNQEGRVALVYSRKVTPEKNVPIPHITTDTADELKPSSKSRTRQQRSNVLHPYLHLRNLHMDPTPPLRPLQPRPKP